MECDGWRRYTPHVAGLYPFLAMFPFVFISGEPSMLAVTAWGLPWLLLGYAISSNARGILWSAATKSEGG